jgi:hypothetical protein
MEQMIVAMMVLPNLIIVPQAQGHSTLNMEGMSLEEFQTLVVKMTNLQTTFN